jgi:hypothetical protein
MDRSASNATMPAVLRFAATADPKRGTLVGARSRDATAGRTNIITSGARIESTTEKEWDTALFTGTVI